jgi:hypothetical protein
MDNPYGDPFIATVVAAHNNRVWWHGVTDTVRALLNAGCRLPEDALELARQEKLRREGVDDGSNDRAGPAGSSSQDAHSGR